MFSKKRAAAILYKTMSSFFAELGTFASYGYDAVEAVKKCVSMRKLQGLDFCKRLLDLWVFGCNLSEEWKKAVSLSREISVVSDEAEKMLLDFSDNFGKNSSEKFLLSCREYEKYFLSLYEKEEESIRKNGSLAVGSGIMAAALFLICFI